MNGLGEKGWPESWSGHGAHEGPTVMRSKKLEGLGEVSVTAEFMTWETLLTASRQEQRQEEN